jgi:CRISPR-associated protein Cas2
MIEPRTGVFVGVLSALVRDKLWEKIQENAAGGAALLIHSARTEQGFQVRTHGDPSRHPVDREGLTLIRVPPRAPPGGKKRAKGLAVPAEHTPAGDDE